MLPCVDTISLFLSSVSQCWQRGVGSLCCYSGLIYSNKLGGIFIDLPRERRELYGEKFFFFPRLLLLLCSFLCNLIKFARLRHYRKERLIIADDIGWINDVKRRCITITALAERKRKTMEVCLIHNIKLSVDEYADDAFLQLAFIFIVWDWSPFAVNKTWKNKSCSHSAKLFFFFFRFFFFFWDD